MIAIDTNVLARVVLNDDAVQSEIARQKLKSVLETEGIFISSFSILELVWIMSVKKKKKEEIVKTLETLLETHHIFIGHDELVRKAVDLFKHGNVDFGDYLIYSHALNHEATSLLTFDKKFAKSSKNTFVKNLT